MQSRRFLLLLVFLVASPSYSQVVMSRVLINPAGNENSHAIREAVGIVNLGTEVQDLSGWFFLSTPPDPADSWSFPLGTEISPGQRYTIYWRTPQPEQSFSDTFFTETTGISLLDNDGGDLALVSPEGIQHYVQWGEAGQVLEELAVAANKWIADKAVPAPDQDQWLQYDGDGFTPEDWGGAMAPTPTAAAGITWGIIKQASSQIPE